MRIKVLIKKALVLSFLLVSSSASYACSFETSDTEQVREVVRTRGGYPVPDNVCNFLNQNGMALSVSADSTVLGGVSIAWVTVRLTKLQRGVVSVTSRQSTKVNTGTASQVTADDMLYEGLGEAVAAFDFVKAAKEVNNFLAKKK